MQDDWVTVRLTLSTSSSRKGFDWQKMKESARQGSETVRALTNWIGSDNLVNMSSLGQQEARYTDGTVLLSMPLEFAQSLVDLPGKKSGQTTVNAISQEEQEDPWTKVQNAFSSHVESVSLGGPKRVR